MIDPPGESVTIPGPRLADTPPSARPRKTLGLTGITINAMALISPGALLWLLYQSQAGSQVTGIAEIWPGVLLALLVALLTSQSLGELARRYPNAGLRSAYHFAESAFQEKASQRRSYGFHLGKWVVGWSAHLYYWIYPGIMVAFSGVLTEYLLHQMGYHPTIFGKLILTCAFSALVGFLALRGITGSTTSSVILNVLQLSSLIFFSIIAIIFRGSNPAGLAASEWSSPSGIDVLLPHSPQGLIFQAALAMLLMVGFEASTALGAKAANAARDVPRAAVLALVIQGAFAYLLEYFAAGLAFNNRIDLLGSRLPVADLSRQIGDVLLGGNGVTVMLTIAFTIFVALLGSALTALNNGVRISFSMSLDREMPSVLSFLHPRYATPYITVLLLSGVSALIGSIGLLGGLPALMGLVLASNLGAFILYAMLSLLTIIAYRGTPEFNFFKHLFLPVLGLVANLGIAVAFPLIGILSGGILAQASGVALVAGFFWILVSAVYYLSRSR